MASFVWNYFTKDKPSKGIATCTQDSCTTEVKYTNGTSALRYHLQQAHSISEQKHEEQKAKRQKTLHASFAAAPPVSNSKNFRHLPQQKRLAVLWSEEDLAFRLIDRPNFRACFSSNIPSGFDRKELSSTIKDFSEELTDDVTKALKGKVVTLAWDGWTDCRQDKNVNSILLYGGKPYFMRSHEVDHNDTDSLENVFETDCKYARDNIGVFVLAGVCDNAPAYQNALARMLDKDLIQIAVRCALHSIALVMKDVAELNPIASATKTLDTVLEKFADHTLHKRLTALQVAAGVTVNRLLKPVSTRIGVKFYCLERIVKLRPYISTIMPEITMPQWLSVESAVTALKPFASAFLTCERDDATLCTVYSEFLNLETSIGTLERTDGLKTFARSVKPILGERWAKQFDSVAVRTVMMCDPQRDGDIPAMQCIECSAWLVRLGKKLYQFKNKSEVQDGFEDTLTSELGAFYAKSEPFNMMDYSKPYWTFWKQCRLVAPTLSNVMLDLGEARPSEASVERCFSKHGNVLRPKRNKLARETVHAILNISFNYRLLHEWSESHNRAAEELKD